jgi:hypothetical protein
MEETRILNFSQSLENTEKYKRICIGYHWKALDQLCCSHIINFHPDQTVEQL